MSSDNEQNKRKAPYMEISHAKDHKKSSNPTVFSSEIIF